MFRLVKGGSEGITALLAGEIDLAFVSVTGVRAIGPGRLKPLGVTCARRDPGLSAVPTFAESGVKIMTQHSGTVYSPRAAHAL